MARKLAKKTADNLVNTMTLIEDNALAAQIAVQPAQAEEPKARTIRCVECAHEWELSAEDRRIENVRCPVCRAWNVVRLHPNRENYVRGLGTTASGNDTLDVNDDVAQMLRGLTLDELYKVAARQMVKWHDQHGTKWLSKGMKKAMKGITWEDRDVAEFLALRYALRNEGMQRMNVGNVLRAGQKRVVEIIMTTVEK